ncbi:MAG: ABC transporter ATP-binding protein [Gemmatimonadales bacterium]|jgi:lipoprotein-releasing system ATP-binding protein|nr:ABC transporter ATP-binding protein [Gemmatimonadales bacterium]
MTALLEATGVRKTYRGGGDSLVPVLTNVDISVAKGEAVAIVGSSGSGKSTLLHLLGALDTPTAGAIALDGVPYASLDDAARNRLRNERVGFVFQFHHLLREFTALENVAMPLLIGGWDERRARRRAGELLAAVDLAARTTHRPGELSGGEQQRCAVARAMVHNPSLLLADEPSGNLDNFHSGQLHDLLFALVRDTGTALVVVTHNQPLAARADRVLLLQNGELHGVTARDGVI